MEFCGNLLMTKAAWQRCWKAAWQKRPWGSWWTPSPPGDSKVLLPKGDHERCPGLRWAKHGQQLEGGDPSPLLSAGEAKPAALCPALGSPVRETRTSWGDPPQGPSPPGPLPPSATVGVRMPSCVVPTLARQRTQCLQGRCTERHW